MQPRYVLSILPHCIKGEENPPSKNHAEVAIERAAVSPQVYLLFAGSRASVAIKALRSLSLENMSASLPSPALVRWRIFLQLCLQGEYMHLYRLGLELGRCQVSPGALPCDLASQYIAPSHVPGCPDLCHLCTCVHILSVGRWLQGPCRAVKLPPFTATYLASAVERTQSPHLR